MPISDAQPSAGVALISGSRARSMLLGFRASSSASSTPLSPDSPQESAGQVR